MKIQLAYKFTNEDENNVAETMDKVCNVLKEAGHDIYCPVLDDKLPRETEKQVFNHSFNKLNEADALLAVVQSENKSEGMLMEIGYMMAKGKKVIVALKQDVKHTHLRYLAHELIEFINIDDLINKLKNLKI